jgi:RND family efflux transporter MFP subunit
MTTTFLRLSASVLVLATISLVPGCGGQPAAAPPAAAAPTVTVAPVSQQEIVEWREFTGHTEPVKTVEIRPRVSGYIQEVRFQSGQLVKQGDVLFVIDPRWNQAVYDQRKAEFDQTQRESNRTAQLLANKAISTEDADARTARFEEARAALESARLDLEYTKVCAPIDGRVSRALLTEGNYVNGVAGGASLLTTLVSVNPVYVDADVDEASLLKFNQLMADKQLGTAADGRVPVELQLGDETDYPHQGYLESFDNRVDPATGSILMRAVFPNEDGRLVPGLFARVRLPLSARHEALLVSETAIGTDQADKFVLTLSATNTVLYRPVTLGPLIAGLRVVTTGLSASDKVVVNGLSRVRPGMAVTPEPAVAELKPALTTAKR